MRERKAFTLIELLVVIAIIALLLSVLMPALKKAKDQMKDLGCRSNLRSMQMSLTLYGQDFNDKLFGHSFSLVYITWISPYMSDVDKIRYCPMASPKRDQLEEDPATYAGTADEPWSWDTGEEEAEFGSYSYNGFLYDPDHQFWMDVYGGSPADWHPGRGLWPNAWFQSLSDARQPAEVPSFCDGVWTDSWPDGEDYPPIDDEDLYYGSTGWFPYFMQRICVDRHNMAINVSFLDGHAEKVPLEELWILQWHKLFVRNFDIVMP